MLEERMVREEVETTQEELEFSIHGYSRWLTPFGQLARGRKEGMEERGTTRIPDIKDEEQRTDKNGEMIRMQMVC